MADEKNLDTSLEASEEASVKASEEASVEETSLEGTAVEDAVAEAAETRQKSANIKQRGDDEPHWYVVHTYSGYEEKVKKDIMKTIENRRLQDQMFEVMVPTDDVIVEKKVGNKIEKKVVSRKKFPGYVLVHMIKNDVTWYVVRNTRGVTGFVGPGSEPVPLSDAEMIRLGIRVDEIEIDVEVGDPIKVIAGAWENTIGKVKSINQAKQTVTIDMDIFGRSTDVEISVAEIQKLS